MVKIITKTNVEGLNEFNQQGTEILRINYSHQMNQLTD